MKHYRLRITTDTRSHLIGILLVLSATIIWSTVPVGTRLLMRGGGAFSPAFLSAGRLVIAAAIFLIIRAIHCRRTGEHFSVRVQRRGWLVVAAAAVCVNYIFYAIGLRFTTAGATSIVSQVNSVGTVLLAAMLLGERLTRQKLMGMSLAIIGVFTVLLHGNSIHDLLSSNHFIGNLIEIFAALAWPLYAIGQTKLLQAGGSRQVLMPIFVVATLLSLLLLPFTGPLIVHTPTLLDWSVLFFLGAFSTAAAYWLYAAGLQRIETSVATMFNVLMPPFALLFASCMLDEEVHVNAIVGLVFVVSGLVLIAWRRSHSPVRRRNSPRIALKDESISLYRS